MDGYSVQEAASVLGVAEGRVWELLARGVLLGTPEGDSMRVFLKPQPGPIASVGTHDEAPRTNGNGGSQGATGEASAFRELLTEFRNLTERYGQALLALGEARGEVAGLRSRVDQLEARLDLRLPPPADTAPVAWDSLSVPASTPEPTPATPRRATPRPVNTRAPIRRPSRPRKARSSREAVAGFADALARAQDPNAAELGEARVASEPVSDESTEPPVATAAAPDAPEQAPEVATEEAPAEELAAEELVPEPIAAEAFEEAPPADEPTAEVEPPTYSAIVVEPDWFADGDFAWLDAAEMEGSTPAGPAPATPDITEPEPEPASAEQDAQAAEPEPEPQALQEPQIPAEAEAEVAEPEPSPEFEAEAFEAEAEFEPWQPPEPASAETPAEPDVADAPEPPTMSTAVAVEEVEEEVMWLGREPESSAIVRDEPPIEYRAEAEPWPPVDAAPATEVPRPPLAMTEDELSRLALDEGWDESEVAAIRAMITPLPSSTVDLPGAAELHEAMAALEAVPVQADPARDVSRQWAKSAPDDEEPTRHDDWAFEAEPTPPPPAAPRPQTDVTSELRRSAEDPNWLRRRQGPAAEAYRRLRRLFPG